MLRILIADDHDVVRQGVRAQLLQRREWQICAEACDGREAVNLCRELRPDVVVMDLSMPELNGVEATRQIRRELPLTEVLIFTMHDTEQMVRAALTAGARGYVLKSDPEANLTAAVEVLARHKTYLTCSMSDMLLYALLDSGTKWSKNDSQILTVRERELVQMFTEGKTNREVAAQLQISVKTVETHRAAVMRKLDINSIVALVHYAIRNQIVQA